MQCLTRRSHHVEDIVLRRVRRDVQSVEVKICHLHARMSETIFFRLSGELILIFHIQSASRLHANYRRCVVILIAKSGFARDRIRCRHEHDWRTCLWKFRDYSVLRGCGTGKQPSVCQPPDCSYREYLQNLHSESYRLVSGTATAQMWDFAMPPPG